MLGAVFFIRTFFTKRPDAVMPTKKLGRLDMTDTVEAGADVHSRGLNGHVAEGYVVAHMSAEFGRRKIAGLLAKGLPLSEEQRMFSGAASVEGGTGIIERLQSVMENWKALNMSFSIPHFT